MNYPKEFIELLENKEWEKNYIGVGNPNAKILIVGKECATNDYIGYHGEEGIHPNFALWKETVQRMDIKEMEDVEKWGPGMVPNPLYPYKGQLYKKYSEIKDKNGNVVKRRGECGTSATWFNYQKLINIYRDHQNGYPFRSNRQTIDFFKDCFITELSDISRPNNNNLSSTDRQKTECSIRTRFELICKTPFFQNQFSIVILACKPYAEKLDKQRMFGEAKIIEYAPMIIPQLSVNISDDLLESIASQMV